MNNNITYDYSKFVKEVNKYITFQNDSNQKVIKALEDTIKSLNSMNKLNPQEANLFLNILFTSLTASTIVKK